MRCIVSDAAKDPAARSSEPFLEIFLRRDDIHSDSNRDRLSRISIPRSRTLASHQHLQVPNYTIEMALPKIQIRVWFLIWFRCRVVFDMGLDRVSK